MRTSGLCGWRRVFFVRRVLFAVNRKTVRAEVDMYALWLMAVLVELIAHRDDCYRKRTDDEIKGVGASHVRLSLAGIKFRTADEA
jgi:hypothetical protein